MILCAISLTTCFSASYSGSLEHMLASIKLSRECASYYRKIAVIYTSLAWFVQFLNLAFLFYSIFFTGGLMDVTLAPITTYLNVSNLLIPRIILFVIDIYLCAAWTFPHFLSFMLATIFSHQYKQLGRMLEERLADTRKISDSEIETFRQHHRYISSTVAKADDFLKFSNAGAFCCQLCGTILLLYTLIFYHYSMTDPVVMMMRVFWMFGQSFGLSVTIAGGIMVNHYVCTNACFLYRHVLISL